MSGSTPRVLWLWNQDPAAPGFKLDDISGPSPACNFGYGAQWSRQDLTDILQQEKGSEERAYAVAGLRGLKRAAAHGPHVTDLLVTDPKRRKADWPIVFVQFPPAAINDPSGIWLHQYAVDGLNYIVECASSATKTIVVNLSWGPQTGPHDGTPGSKRRSIAWSSKLTERKETDRVARPAGNSYSARAHAQVDYNKGAEGKASLQWIVPPDGRTPQFLEIWWPNGVDPERANVTVAPPGGPAAPVPVGDSFTGKFSTSLLTVGASTMALLVVSPTEDKDPKQRGPHGAWTIAFASNPASVHGDIHIYVARTTHNMGARRRAKASYLTDAKLEDNRFVTPAKRFDEAPGSKIRREGTLSGIATGACSLVATGYCDRDKRAAPYFLQGRRVAPSARTPTAPA